MTISKESRLQQGSTICSGKQSRQKYQKRAETSRAVPISANVARVKATARILQIYPKLNTLEEFGWSRELLCWYEHISRVASTCQVIMCIGALQLCSIYM